MDNKIGIARRKDIDGLRGLAIILVVFYHAYPNFFPTGYLGVDIFFVISGFLITKIILNDITNKNFSISNFYARRIRRIFPALLIVISSILLIGWWVLLENEYKELGKHASSGVGFIANFLLISEVGYFDNEAISKPLLHLWSLAIEEQFYIIWPIFILLFVRKKWLIPLVFILLTLSFLLYTFLSYSNPSLSFYLPLSRFWELLVGCILAVYFLKKGTHIGLISSSPNLVATLGISLIFIALFFLNIDYHENLARSLTIIGTALLLITNQENQISKLTLSNSIIVYIGLISYPLYLWHWPLISLSNIIQQDQLKPKTLILIIALSFFLASITYHLIEKRVQNKKNTPVHQKKITVYLLFTSIIIFIAGLFIFSGAIKPRLSGESLNKLAQAIKDWDYPGDKEATTHRKQADSILFFGDSYIQQYYPRIKKLKQTHSINTIVFKTEGGCAPVRKISRKSNSNCSQFAQEGYTQAIKGNFKTVIIGASWLGMIQRGDYYWSDDKDKKAIDFKRIEGEIVFSNFEMDINKIIESGKEVILVLNPPGGTEANPKNMLLNRYYSQKNLLEVTIPISQHKERTDWINRKIKRLAENTGAKTIDLADWLCDEYKCQFTSKNGTPYYKDDTHFRSSFISNSLRIFDKYLINNK